MSRPITIPQPFQDPPRRGRRFRWLAVATVLMGLLGAGVAVAGSADAATEVFDSFEGNPYDNWSTVEVRGQSLVILSNQRRPRSGTNAAWLYGGQTAATAARMYRLISIERPPNPVSCYGLMWLRKHDESPQTTDPVVTVQLRSGVPSAPSFWTNVFTVSDKVNWQPFYFSGFPFSAFFYLDISATGEVMVDDITVGCTQAIR